MIKLSYASLSPKLTTRVTLQKKKESEIITASNGEKELRLGIGTQGDITRRKFFLLCREAVKLARAHKIKRFTLRFEDFAFPRLRLGDAELAEQMAVNFEMANFEFVKYKTPPLKGWNFVTEVVIVGRLSHAARDGFRRGQVIGSEVNACRTLANTPGGEMTPRIFAEEVRRASRGTRVRTKILGPREMKRLKMGAVLGVAKGSDEEPRFVIMEYWGASRSKKPIVLVGKGVTFDTGGLNLKPESGIYEMHMDMSGGAAVAHAVLLAAKLKLKKNVIALVPTVENMPSGSSYHPGDVLRSMSGKTIEVLNTDAEGRVILADGLEYAKRYKPRLVVDVATLTGSAMSALGQRASAIFTADAKLEMLVRELGEESGDYVWPLPLWEEYEEEIKGTFGDVANIGKVRSGGAIQGAVFLWQFIKDYPWMHIDMAPRMTAIEGEYLAKGAAGAPVRLLLKLIERF